MVVNGIMLKSVVGHKAMRNYLVDLTALLPFSLLLASGVIMLIYHSGIEQERNVLWLDGDEWLLFHRAAALIALPLVGLHLGLHWRPLLRLFMPGKGPGHKPLNLWLFILLVATSASSLAVWAFLSSEPAAELLIDIHSKSGMALIILFAAHLALNLPWLLRMTRRLKADRQRGS